MNKLRYFITNKYLLTGVVFVIWLLFFDRNDMFLQMRRVSELQKLQESEKNLSLLINSTRQELDLLKNNPETLEKYAREKYLMKKDNEDLFVITLDSSLIR